MESGISLVCAISGVLEMLSLVITLLGSRTLPRSYGYKTTTPKKVPGLPPYDSMKFLTNLKSPSIFFGQSENCGHVFPLCMMIIMIVWRSFEQMRRQRNVRNTTAMIGMIISLDVDWAQQVGCDYNTTAQSLLILLRNSGQVRLVGNPIIYYSSSFYHR